MTNDTTTKLIIDSLFSIDSGQVNKLLTKYDELRKNVNNETSSAAKREIPKLSDVNTITCKKWKTTRLENSIDKQTVKYRLFFSEIIHRLDIW